MRWPMAAAAETVGGPTEVSASFVGRGDRFRAGVHRCIAFAAAASTVLAVLALTTGSARASHGDGKIAFADDGQIWVLHPDGSKEQVTEYEGPFASDPRWSPDGTQLAWLFFEGARVRSIVVADADGSNQEVLVEAHNCASPPAWSPDGSLIAGTDCSIEDSFSQLFLVPIGGGEPTTLSTPNTAYAPDFSPDGSKLVFEDRPVPGSQPSNVDERDMWDLATINVDGSGYERVGLADGTNRPEPASPAWRPTGDSFAYQFEASSSSCAQRVMIADAADLSTREVDTPDASPSSVCGVSPPRWNGDGSALTYTYCDRGSPDMDPACHVAVVDQDAGASAERLFTLDSFVSEDHITLNAPDWHGTAVPGHRPTTTSSTSTTTTTTTTTSTTTTTTTTTTAPSSPTSADALVASATSVAAGGQITVTGDGFAAGSTVTLTLFSNPVDLGTSAVDANGSFSETVTIPATVPAGQHRIVATGTALDGSARSIEVVITVTAAPSGTLPDTGGDSVPMVAIAALVVASLALRSAAYPHRP